MRRFLVAMALSAGLGVSSLASASSIFSDNFNGENGGSPTLNYYGFANWTVPVGSVDLIGNGYFDFLPGNGLYVDLDGSTGQAGTMVSSPISLSAGSYDFKFDLAGDQRNAPPEPVTAAVDGGIVSQVYLLPSAQGFTTFNLPFTLSTPQVVTLSFAETGNSNMGMLLDNVDLSSITSTAGAPLPPAFVTGSALMALMGAAKLRRKLAI